MKPRNVVILGATSEALTLAQALMRPEFRVTLIDPDLGAGERAQHFLTQMQGDANLMPDVTASHQPLESADVVFEALEGNPAHRSKALSRLTLPSQALLASVNRHVLSGWVGFHLFAPAHMRRLVEITPGPDMPTQAAFDLAADMGRVPVLAPINTASIGQRLQRRLNQAAEALLLQGAIPHELDEAMVDFGFDMGVFEAQDLIGLNVAYSDRKRTARPALISDRMVQEGRLGKQASVGWYRYPGGGGAVIDPLVEDLIREEARFARVVQHEVNAQEMQKTLVQGLNDEGLTLLADGYTAADINLTSIHGLGFPATLGGILHQ